MALHPSVSDRRGDAPTPIPGKVASIPTRGQKLPSLFCRGKRESVSDLKSSDRQGAGVLNPNSRTETKSELRGEQAYFLVTTGGVRIKPFGRM